MRGKYLIHKGLQFRYAVTIFIATSVVSVLAVWTTYLTTWEEIVRQLNSEAMYSRLEQGFDSAEPRDQNRESVNAIIAVEFSDVFDRVSLVLLIRLLIGSVALFVLSIFVSHKIAGPAWRIERAAKALQKGDLSVDMSKLRLGDELSGLAEALHIGLGRIRTVVDESRAKAVLLETMLCETDGHLANAAAGAKDIKRARGKTQQLAKELVASLSRLKTTSRSLAAASSADAAPKE